VPSLSLQGAPRAFAPHLPILAVISPAGQEGRADGGPGDVALRRAAALGRSGEHDEKWRQQQPDPGNPDGGFDHRYIQAGTTFGGAAVIRGNLTPQSATAVGAVLETRGKKAAPEDDRTEGKRFHDAL
jgi:hypothetical protein